MTNENKHPVTLVECPRDAMQGWPHFIPTHQKTKYLNALLQVGFDVLDFGSFVSPKAIPQMADTAVVLERLDLSSTSTKLLAIVANLRGAQQAVSFPQIHYLGFPLSLSETFQQRNTNASIEEALSRVAEIGLLCQKHQKQLVVYLSMGFGNPYGDAYNEDIVHRYATRLQGMGIQIISLADTVGLATPVMIQNVTTSLIAAMPQVTFGVHLHSGPHNWKQKLEAAFAAGCRRFDGALKGIGGCPMAGDALVGNMATEWLLSFLAEKGLAPALNETALQESMHLADQIFI